MINVIYGRDAIMLAPYGEDPDIGHTDGGFTIYTLYGQYKKEKWSFLAGNFDSLVGYEGTDVTNNTNYSRSLLATFTQPGTHLGFRASYEVQENLTFKIGVNNGWDTIRDFSRDPTYEFGLAYAPIPELNLAAQAYFGEERTVSQTTDTPKGNRGLLDIVLSYQATKKLQLVANYDYGIQKNIVFSDGSVGTAVWSGIAGYVNYVFNDQWRTSFRAEIFDDNKPYRTGNQQVLKEMTLTLAYAPIKNVELRAETRRDYSNHLYFQDKSDGTPRKIQQSYALELVVSLSS